MTRPMSLYEKYLLTRDLFSAVPLQVAAHVAHCTPAEARDLFQEVIQLLRRSSIYYQPRSVTISPTINIVTIARPPRTSILRRSRRSRWSDTPPTQDPENILRYVDEEEDGPHQPNPQGPHQPNPDARPRVPGQPSYTLRYVYEEEDHQPNPQGPHQPNPDARPRVPGQPPYTITRFHPY